MENKDKHGLSINILKFQWFNFEFFNCQEIVLYETLMVLGGISFTGREEFFHSTQTLADKTGIKRHSVDRILMKFKKIGIIDYEIKGMPKVKHIKILWDNILEMLPEIYQFDKVKEYFDGSTQPLIDFYKLLAENDKKIAEKSKEKNTIKNSTEEYEEENKQIYIVSAKAENYAKDTLEQLKSVFQDRIKKYNDENRNQKKFTELPVKKSSLHKLYNALNVIDRQDIINAFIAFADEMLYMKVRPKLDALSYFLTEENGEYPVVFKYQLKFIIQYSTH